MKLLIADNNDSFTWNLVQLAREAGAVDIQVVDPAGIIHTDVATFDRIMFSPGPGLPEEFPSMFSILGSFPHKRILGVCLGLQAIGVHFGGSLINMDEPMHGRQVKVSVIAPDYIFDGVPEQFDAGLYHSWVLSEKGLPASLVVTARSDDRRIMALRHRQLDIHAVQFHPESVMTPAGLAIMRNFLFKNP
jgi:anthranilate synthase component 2